MQRECFEHIRTSRFAGQRNDQGPRGLRVVLVRDLPREVRKSMTFVPVDTIDEVLEAAFPGAKVLEFSSAAQG